MRVTIKITIRVRVSSKGRARVRRSGLRSMLARKAVGALVVEGVFYSGSHFVVIGIIIRFARVCAGYKNDSI